MTINELCEKAHSAAVAKGWYERNRELPEFLMLIVSELSEAMEADRKGDWAEPKDAEWYLAKDLTDAKVRGGFEMSVKDMVQDELADTFIRLADLCGHYGIDIESYILAKMRYNETRPQMHGKKY